MEKTPAQDHEGLALKIRKACEFGKQGRDNGIIEEGYPMKQAESGDTVKVNFTGRLEDGTVFDTTKDGEPFKFTIGEGHIIKGFDSAVSGMSKGEKKTITIPPEDAYEAYRDELKAKVSRKQFPPDIEPEKGLRMIMKQPDGENLEVTIIDIVGDEITIDANHTLAGKRLTFDLELVDIL
jgi:peptidylprolyl isomerase